MSVATGKNIHLDNAPIDLTCDSMNNYFSNIGCELNAQFNNTSATWKGPSSIHITPIPITIVALKLIAHYYGTLSLQMFARNLRVVSLLYKTKSYHSSKILARCLLFLLSVSH